MTNGCIAVVGASLAGGRAALSLRERGFDGEIHLIGSERHPPYERPPLSKGVLSKMLPVEEAYLVDEADWERSEIALHLSTTVSSIDANTQSLELSAGGRLRVDGVVLCTGARPHQLKLPGTDLGGVATLRVIDDAEAIGQRLLRGGPVVIIGGGFIGMEVAATANMMGCSVTVLEAGDVPLSQAIGAEVAWWITEKLRERGVSFLTRTSATKIEGTHGNVTHVITTSGGKLPASAVVIGVGVSPNTDLAIACGAKVDNGIVVNEFCETSVPSVYAAGDVASSPDVILGRRTRLEHWQNAQNQGIAAAGSVLGHRVPFREVPWFWSDQADLNIQVAGHPRGSDETVFRGDPESDEFTVFFLTGGVMTGAIAINDRRTLRSSIRLIGARSRVEAALLGDTNVALPKLARKV